MDSTERSLHVARISAGILILRIKGTEYVLRTASPEDVYRSELLYSEALRDAHFTGLLTEDEALAVLNARRIWTGADEEVFQNAQKDLSNFKIRLFQSTHKPADRRELKRLLDAVKQKIGELSQRRATLDHLTCEGYAQSVKSRFLLVRSLGLQYDDPCPDLDLIIDEVNRNTLTEAQIRELARTEPWRNIWGARKSGCPPFSSPVVALSIEQRMLLLWSQLYDTVREADIPDVVIEDDDALDGWMLLKQKEQEKDQAKSYLEEKTTEKIRNCDEVYIIPQERSELNEIYNLNDDIAKSIIRARREYVKSVGGESKFQHLPDVANELQMQINRAHFGN